MRIYKMALFVLILSFCLLIGCNTFKKSVQPIVTVISPVIDTVINTPVKLETDKSKTDSFLVDLLKANPSLFDSITANKDAFNMQFIYSKIDRGANGIAALKNYYYHINPEKYFYPASTVKLPICILALQKLNELKEKGIDKYTTMLTEQAYSNETAVFNDPTTVDGKPTIANYIKKILLISDNDAFNRLYEFLGQQYINEQLHQKGFATAQIRNRLGIQLTDDENRHTNPVNFLRADNKILFAQPMQFNQTKFEDRKDSLGNAFYQGKELVNTPMDFSNKNRISLEDFHEILISLVFPNKVTASQRYNISDEDRKFLLKTMSQFPTESIRPPYADEKEKYYPAYNKFLFFGAEKKALPTSIRSFNKTGEAYGQLIDVAYIVDFDKKIEFFLSAVIYCNSNGILNDDTYDYEKLGYPFLKNLGQVIYDYELKRDKKIIPDLSDVKFDYNNQ